MNFNYFLLAAAKNTTDGGSQGGVVGALMTFAPLVLLFVLMYFMIIRPQRKKQKEEQKMRDSLQVGDEIVTIGGIYGTVAEVKDAYVLLEVDKDVKIRVNKQAIQKDYTDPAK